MNHAIKFKNLCTLLLLIVCSGSARADFTFWDAAAGGNGHWYQAVVTPDGISWTDAQAGATAAGGYLVTIRSLAEQTFVGSNVLVENPNPGEAALQTSFWTGGVADVTDLSLLTLTVATTYHWDNGESWDYDNFATATDADGIDSTANGTVVPFPGLPDYFASGTSEILASYVRISTSSPERIWSDHPEDGTLARMEVDALTGDITTPLTDYQYIYGYVIEFEENPTPEPSSLALLGLGGLVFARRRRG